MLDFMPKADSHTNTAKLDTLKAQAAGQQGGPERAAGCLGQLQLSLEVLEGSRRAACLRMNAL